MSLLVVRLIRGNFRCRVALPRRLNIGMLSYVSLI